MLFSVFVQAHSEEFDDFADFSIIELMQVDLTISSKNKENLINSPSSVTFFTASDLQALGVTRLMDLVNFIPGFYSMMNAVEGNQSHLVMRGHSQKYANTLLLLLNGQRINDDYTGGLNYLMRFHSLADIERIEVIRGPGSAIYGSNAFTGVINIITKVKSHVVARVGNLSAKHLSVGWATQLDTWDLGASFQYEDDKGDRFDGVFDRNQLQTQTKDPTQMFQSRLELNRDDTQIQAQWLKSEREDYYLFRRLRDGVTNIKLEHFVFSAEHELEITKDNIIALGAGWQKANRESITALTPQGEAPFERVDFLFGENFKYTSFNFGADGRWRIDETLTVNYGLSYTESQVPDGFLQSNFDLFGDFSQLDGVTLFNKPEQRVVLDKTREISSLYLQGQWQVNTKLKVTGGLRYDKYNDVDNELMPRLAATYQHDNKHAFKFMYGQGYKAPSLGDLYDEESGLTTGNRSLEASEIATYEFAYLYTEKNVSLVTTLFFNEQSNIVGFRTDAEDNVFLDNVAGNDASGMEIELNWQISEPWRVKTALTHLIENDTDLGMSTGLPASEEISPESYLNMQSKITMGDWVWNLSGYWRSSVDVLSGSGLAVVNTNVGYRFDDQLSFKIIVNNLFDEKYDTSSYIVLGATPQGQNIQHYPARGIEILAGLRYQF
mgnify:CR=1 FL=1